MTGTVVRPGKGIKDIELAGGKRVRLCEKRDGSFNIPVFLSQSVPHIVQSLIIVRFLPENGLHDLKSFLPVAVVGIEVPEEEGHFCGIRPPGDSFPGSLDGFLKMS